MGTHYSQLSLAERIEIYHLFANGNSFRAIAAAIGRATSTVSREIRRNSKVTKQYAGGYCADRAHKLASRRRRWDARFKMQRQPALQKHVHDRLAMGWSPQQIAGRLAYENAPMCIAHESIYRFIYHRANQRDPWHHLLARRKHRRGAIRRGHPGPQLNIKHRRSIHERPKAVNQRLQPGHWEVDLMMFRAPGPGLLVIHDRLSRMIKLKHLENKTATNVLKKLIKTMGTIPQHLRRTLTFDNGQEFAHHHKLSDKYGIDNFFCDAYAPWQKGGVENAIGRMRTMLPRARDLNTLSHQKLRAIAEVYNNTPRKCLGYRTPNEIFNSVALQP